MDQNMCFIQKRNKMIAIILLVGTNVSYFIKIYCWSKYYFFLWNNIIESIDIFIGILKMSEDIKIGNNVCDS